MCGRDTGDEGSVTEGKRGEEVKMEVEK